MLRAAPVLLLLAMVALLAACGNNRMREEWHDARDAINKPFR